MESRVVDDFAGLSAQERLAWDAIAAEQAVFTPFLSLFWYETWWTAFGDSSASVDRKLLIYVMRRGGEAVAFFPMFRQTNLRFGLKLLRHIKPLGADGNLTELRTGIVRTGHEREAYAALADYLQSSERQWDAITLPALPAEAGDVYDAFPAHPTVAVKEGFVLPLAADWDSFRSGLKRNIKESIRKCTNSVKRDGIELKFSCLSEPGAIQAMLPQFYRLHKLRAAQEAGNQHRDYFRRDAARQFLDALVREAPRSGIRLFTLSDGDRLVAARLGFENAAGTYLYYSGYDLDYGKYSVPTQLVIDVVKRAIASGQQNVHLSFGRDVSKTRWGPREMGFKCRLIFQKSVRGLVAAELVAYRRRKVARLRAAAFELKDD